MHFIIAFLIEQDFRALKSGFLEIRPIFVRKDARTRGHVFIAMLGLKIVRLMRQKLEVTEHKVEDALNALLRYVYLIYEINNKQVIKLPQGDQIQKEVFAAMGIKLPDKNAKTQNVGRAKK